MSASRVELVQAEMMADLEAVTVANGYRTDVQKVVSVPLELKAVSAWPTLALIFGEEKIHRETIHGGTPPIGSRWTSYIDVWIVGYASGSMKWSNEVSKLKDDYLVPLVHDLKKVMDKWALKQSGMPGSTWFLTPKVDPLFNKTWFAEESKGWVELEFSLTVWAQDGREF